MTTLREGLPPMPARMLHLPLDHRGYPVPWFVAWFDGKPDFRVMDTKKIVLAVKQRRCWLCGEFLGRKMAFVIGPMCAVNRVSAEPPSHRECAEFSAKACPFLTLPKALRREANLPTNTLDPAGFMLERNPGVTLVWITESFKPFRADGRGGSGKGVLFQIGDAVSCLWYCEGRPATRAEVEASIASGLPVLEEKCALDEKPEEAKIALRHALQQAQQLLPA